MFLCLLFTVQVQAQTIDQIVGVVGDKIILHSEIDAQLQQAAKSGYPAGPGEYCSLLEEILFQKLLVHQAEVDSLDVTDEQVESEMNNRISVFIQQIGSREKLEDFYGKSIDQIKEEFRDRIKESIQAQKMQAQITQDVKVTPEDIRKFYYAIPKDSLPYMGSQVEVAHIVKIPKVSVEEKTRIREELNAWRDEIVSGKTKFSTIASFYSEDPGTRSNGGQFELIPRGTFVPEFDAVAFSMREGEISEVFETPYGYHIFLLEERRGDMYRGRHILRIPKLTSVQISRASEQLDSLYKAISAGKITFEQAALRFSDDAETKFNGGKIFNPQTGSPKFEVRDLDKQLFITIDKMKVGDVSEPVYMTTNDNKQAVRIVKLVNRSEPHRADLKLDYPEISDAALADKKQKAVLAWVKSKISTVYVWVEESKRSCPFEYPWMTENQ